MKSPSLKNHKRRLSLCFILLLILVSKVYANNSISFATHTTPPLSLFLQEVLQTALKPYHKKVTVIEMPGRRVILQVNQGKVVGDAARAGDFKVISNDDTSNYVRVNEAVALTKVVMITRKTSTPEQVSWHELNKGTVAYLSGSKRLRKNVYDDNRVPVSTSKQALEMLARERVKSVVMFESTARNLITNDEHLLATLTIQQPLVDRFNLFTFIHKDHAELVPLLEASLKEMKRNGAYQQIADKYYFSMPLPLSNG